MAQGSIKKRLLDGGRVRWDVIVDLGADPVTGKRRQRKKTFETRKEAQSGLATWLAGIDQGVAVDRSRQTVAEMMDYWLDTYARHKVMATTLALYARTVRQHIVPALGPIPVQKLTPAQLQAFYAEKLTAGVGPRTVQFCHQRLAQALDQALKLGLVSRNVTTSVTPPRWQAAEMRTWSVDDAQRFMSVAPQSIYGPLWILALATGMRRGEVLGLRWQDVDVERGVLAVRQTVVALNGAPHIQAPKTRSSRREIPVTGEVMEALREHKRRQNAHRLALGAAWHEHDLVFCAGHGGPIWPDNLKVDFARLVARAGVPLIRIHDLRHSHVTLALQQGANLKAVSERVGHANVRITLGTYAHVLPSQHAEVATKVGSILFGQAPHETQSERA